MNNIAIFLMFLNFDLFGMITALAIKLLREWNNMYIQSFF